MRQCRRRLRTTRTVVRDADLGNAILVGATNLAQATYIAGLPRNSRSNSSPRKKAFLLDRAPGRDGNRGQQSVESTEPGSTITSSSL